MKYLGAKFVFDNRFITPYSWIGKIGKNNCGEGTKKKGAQENEWKPRCACHGQGRRERETLGAVEKE